MPLGTVGPAALQMLWTTWGQLLFPIFPTLSLKREPVSRANGYHRFNRSSLTMSSASLGPVEKSGADFHRLALPSLLKSPIRSIPKSGSGVV